MIVYRLDARHRKEQTMEQQTLETIYQAAPKEEPARQYYFIEQDRKLLWENFLRRYEAGDIAALYGASEALRRKTDRICGTACTVTFGCQMNARDSEKIAGLLKSVGYALTEQEEHADFVLFNTCTIRENANEHLYGRLGHLKHSKAADPDRIVAVCGCMMQEEDEVKKVQEKYPYVDIIFGTHNLYSLAELLFCLLMRRNDQRRKKAKERRVVEVLNAADRIVEELPSERKYPFKQGVNISFGCNNFCTYCIVPYVRGRERSRKSADILKEVEQLSKEGVLEVMLLGQNVNSYGNDNPEEISFPALLRRVCQVPGIERVRFMTSHPKDLSDELIEVMAEEPKICRHLHLPMQSGSTAVLKAMNRRYTKEQFLSLVSKIRKAIPDLSLTTDIIVGFPGETEADFQDTLSVVRQCRFDSAYTFIYSRRSGTPAAKLPPLPEDIVKDRFQRLLSVVEEVAQKESGRDTGRTLKALIESAQKDGDRWLLTGRLSNNMLVHFPGDKSLVGTLVSVKLTEAKGFYYMGELVR